MKTYCLTNEKHYWLLPGFLDLYHQFWPHGRVEVVGYGAPSFPLGVPFRSIAPHNYPAEQWTTGLIEFLRSIEDEYFVLMLEDYWLTAPVPGSVAMLCNAVASGYFGEKFLRLDLSADRAAHPYTLHERVAGYEVISTPPHTPYQMSFQAAIWHRANLLAVLVAGETPWQAEVHGSKRLRGTDWLVLGTLSRPLVYTPVWRSQQGRANLEGLPAPQRQALMRQIQMQHAREVAYA